MSTDIDSIIISVSIKIIVPYKYNEPVTAVYR